MKLLAKIKDFYSRYREIINYLFFGGLSFLLNVGVFCLFNKCFSLNELVSNIVSWIITIIFVFITNRKWVFQDCDKSKKSLFKQFLSFLIGRLSSLLVEELIIFVFITKLKLNSVAVKIVAQIVVIILNYVLSKVWIFKKIDKDDEHRTNKK